ncbi:hypothetical protein [Erythrobacter sp. JK5]|uniref:hypothetical protein n=1 Tax=Erythrobacter sp. JK5 TaxID=2829500 RepID=UPI001BA475C3|nr:hypothetical protein [Erythrobacter sp. JK5]QUL36508.1 hypothetical protein KDC96_08605 [Erythrobacter sp. JK5]
MGHVTRDIAWCEIDIDTTNRVIFLQQRWLYNWIVAPGQTAWTATERRDFHNAADRLVWQYWSGRAFLRARGTSQVARTPGNYVVNWDIRWVTSNQHWTVTVQKIAPSAQVTSSVRWNARTISLDTNDINPRTVSTSRPTNRQYPVAHEFGHSAGNTAVLGRGDEYPASSPHNSDFRSMMNQGSELRTRHFDTIIGELNTMIPNTTFQVAVIR